MPRLAKVHPAALLAALVLVTSASAARAEAEPEAVAEVAAHELAHTLQQQRQQIAEARALLAAGVTDRSAADAADPASASLDALEAALVAEKLLAPGATGAVAERGMLAPALVKHVPARTPPSVTKIPAAPVKSPVPIPYPSASKAASGMAVKLPPPAAAQPDLAGVARLIGNGAPKDVVERRWLQAIKGVAPGTDPNALVQHVLRESLLESQRDLRHYADKVAYYNELKKTLREQLTSMRAQLVAAKSAAEKSSLEAKIEELEKRLQSAGDDGELANVDLQKALQKQQQALQTMSSIAKKLNDTAMSVIRKLGS